MIVLAGIVKGQIITTVAGNGSTVWTGDGGQATAAGINVPEGRVIFDAAGNFYWADGFYGRVRKVDGTGIISSITGGGNAQPGDGGLAINSSMYHVGEVAFDHIGNMYLVDEYDFTVRKINTAGIITTITGIFYSNGYTGDGGPATAAQLDYPNGVGCDAAGNVYITSSNSVRKVNVSSGIITTVVGDSMSGYSGDGGQATAARLRQPHGVTFDASDNMYITDWYNHVIRKVNTAGIISTVAGNGFGAGTSYGGYSGDGGQATAAKLNNPIGGVAFDAVGNMYIADYRNNVIRMVNTAGIITTIAGNGTASYSGDGGSPIAAELNYPSGVAIDANGNLYISDGDNRRIRKVTNPSTINVQTYNPQNSTFHIYPNPAQNNFTVEVSNNDKQTLSVFDINGKLILSQTIYNTTNIDASTFNAGVYSLNITNTQGTLTKKLVIVK